MKGLESYERRLEVLSVGNREAMSPEFQALLDSLSEDQVIELSNMLMGIKPDPRILPPGTLPETPRDCARCGFRLTGNAALLQHVPCNYLESGDFRP
jgi:hypothetical protein